MGQGAIAIGPAFAVVLVVLVIVAAAAATIRRLGVARATVMASLRAVLQLAAVSSLIPAVLRSWWATAGFIALMTAVAVATSARVPRRGPGKPGPAGRAARSRRPARS